MKKHQNYQLFLSEQITLPSRLLSQYHTLSITEQELIVILHIHHAFLRGKYFPTPFEIAELSTFDEQTCSQLLRQLMQKNLLTIIETKDNQGVVDECYSLEPLWELLYSKKTEPKNDEKQSSMNIFILFEQEFGRPLSPFEIETINIWLDEEVFEPSLIKAALRESVLMSKLNFKYIDRILREWKRKGIRTVSDARAESKAFHNSKRSTESSRPTKRDTSVYYNWLEEDE
ncbi:DnaD domain-containing protein [Amphibacillus jilinensis]|uniref:DnaD domain-containing protein n=1 Tax=Amphibacillus jilinensis TaxID=1216008 RepID=UPI0002E61019|nr:DnaD domain-containing protein [Amphibacillus jilinensis]